MLLTRPADLRYLRSVTEDLRNPLVAPLKRARLRVPKGPGSQLVAPLMRARLLVSKGMGGQLAAPLKRARLLSNRGAQPHGSPGPRVRWRHPTPQV